MIATMAKKKTSKGPHITTAFPVIELEGIAEELSSMVKAVLDSIKAANAQPERMLACFHRTSLVKGMSQMKVFISDLESARLEARIGNPRPVGMRKSRSVDAVESIEKKVAEGKEDYRKSTKKKGG
jgi:hypothetical protein